MKRFIIDEGFWELFPNVKIGVVVCNGIDNSIKDTEAYEAMLSQAQLEAKKYLTKDDFSSNEVIAVWREAFQKFKTKKGARASIEAMLKRINNGNSIRTINPLVDIYNSISLRYGLPCGGEDIDKFQGDNHLTLANGSEEFWPLGSDENEPPYAGEVIYKDEAGAICRCWNWREAQRTMLTEETRNAFLCIESVDAGREGEFMAALHELSDLVPRYLGGEAKLYILDMNNREMRIE